MALGSFSRVAIFLALELFSLKFGFELFIFLDEVAFLRVDARFVAVRQVSQPRRFQLEERKGHSFLIDTRYQFHFFSLRILLNYLRRWNSLHLAV